MATRETRDDPFTHALAKVLRHAHLDSKIAKKDLAKNAGIGLTTLNRYLDGERPIPADYYRKICLALGVSPAALFDEAERALDQEAGGDS